MIGVIGIVISLLLLMYLAYRGITVLILAPILFPIATQLGIDPVHLGIIMVVNLEIGMVTPPIGLNLFVTAGITNMSHGEVARRALPWPSILPRSRRRPGWPTDRTAPRWRNRSCCSHRRPASGRH